MITSRFDESMNGAVFLALAFAVVMFGLYLWDEMRENGYRTRAKAAASISGMLAGEMILRGWFWVRAWRIDGYKVSEWISGYPITSAGKVIEMVGVLCLIRVFAPDHWSRATWVAVGMASVVIAVVAGFGW
jgi:hypothetical protein